MCYLYSFHAPNRSWERAGLNIIIWLVAGNLRLVIRANRAEAQTMMRRLISAMNSGFITHSGMLTVTHSQHKGTLLARIRLAHRLRHYHIFHCQLRLIHPLCFVYTTETQKAHFVTHTRFFLSTTARGRQRLQHYPHSGE